MFILIFDQDIAFGPFTSREYAESFAVKHAHEYFDDCDDLETFEDLLDADLVYELYELTPADLD